MIDELFNIKAFPIISGRYYKISVKINELFSIYLILFGFVMLSGTIIRGTDYIVTHLLHFNGIYNRDNSSLKDYLKHLGYLKGGLIICLIGPLLEELVFRLPLSLKKIHIAIALAVAILFFSGKLYTLTGVDWQLIFRLFAAVSAFCLTMKFGPDNLHLIDNKYKTIIDIVSICLFGFMHISNYKPIQWPIIFLYPIYTIPQLCLGWGLTYIRLKNGFIWCVLLHCLVNLLYFFAYL